jgi:hypothetical protein
VGANGGFGVPAAAAARLGDDVHQGK